MKRSAFFLTLVFAACSLTSGAQYLTINGEQIDSIKVSMGQSCTVEVVSDDSTGYTVGCGTGLGLPDGTVITATPQAGSAATIIETVPVFYGLWQITAAGDDIVPGVHFIFEIAPQVGSHTVYITDPSFVAVIDQVTIQFVEADPFRTAFSYSGKLTNAGDPADGFYDHRYTLFDSLDLEVPLTQPVLLEDIRVADGHFTVELDFGSDVFDGKIRYLEIAVRPGEVDDPNAFVTLQPRQEITATPYALRAKNAESVNLEAIFASPSPGPGIIPQVSKDQRFARSVVRQDNFNIGIGTTSDITDRLQVGSNLDSESFLSLNCKWTGKTGIRFNSDPLGAELVYDQYEKALSWYITRDVATGPVERIHVDEWGKVGIGVSNPQSTLHVAGYVQSNGGFKFPDGTVQKTAAGPGGGGGTITGVEAGTGLEGGGYGGVVSLGLEIPLDLYVDTPDAVIRVTNDTGNYGLVGESDFIGVSGSGTTAGVGGSTNAVSGLGVRGRATGDQGTGVFGLADPRTDTGPSYGGRFLSTGTQGVGVYASAVTGIIGESETVSGIGVQGKSTQKDGIGVEGTGETGVAGFSDQTGGKAVYGRAEGSAGTGGSFESVSGNAVRAVSEGSGISRSAGHFEGQNDSGVGIFSSGGANGYAAVFEGNVLLRSPTDSTTIMELGEGLDYAEGFDLSGKQAHTPGTVLIIDPDHPGKLTISSSAYDKKVAGIIAGADGLGSGVRLGAGKFDHDVALAGRVYCNVDAIEHAIEPGDLLTTSTTPGHAMKVTDYSAAQGAVLGKAMERMEKGKTGRILVLVTLQ